MLTQETRSCAPYFFRVIVHCRARIVTAECGDERRERPRDFLRGYHESNPPRTRRYCLVCGKIITGQQIQVAGGARDDGTLRVSCPSERCNSIPMDWVLPTDEILARVEMLAAKEHEVATSTLINHGRMPERPHETHHGITATTWAAVAIAHISVATPIDTRKPVP